MNLKDMEENSKKENDFGLKDSKGDTIYSNKLDNVGAARCKNQNSSFFISPGVCVSFLLSYT